jgi:hypothetical protein
MDCGGSPPFSIPVSAALARPGGATLGRTEGNRDDNKLRIRLRITTAV